MRQVGKVGQRRAKGLKKVAPIICERAGGFWAGESGCIGAHCEVCGRAGVVLQMAHIRSRAQCGNEDVTNLILLCQECHYTMDNGDAETREQMRGKAKDIAGRVTE